MLVFQGFFGIIKIFYIKLILPRNLFLSSALNFVVEKPISSGKAETVALKINIMQTSAAAAPPKNLPNLCITLMHLAINIPFPAAESGF